MLRGARGMTQAELAESIGVGTEYVGRIERGEKRVQLEDLARAATALEVSLGELFQGIGEPRKHGRDRGAKSGGKRQPASEQDATALVQLLALLDAADVAALTAVAERMLAASSSARRT